MSEREVVVPIDAGCPHCGRAEPHPRSSPPTNPKGTVVAKPVITVKVEPVSAALPVERVSGKLAYDTWVLHVGHGDAAVPWEKLTSRAQGAWSAVARSCEDQTAKFMHSQASSPVKK